MCFSATHLVMRFQFYRPDFRLFFHPFHLLRLLLLLLVLYFKDLFFLTVLLVLNISLSFCPCALHSACADRLDAEAVAQQLQLASEHGPAAECALIEQTFADARALDAGTAGSAGNAGAEAVIRHPLHPDWVPVAVMPILPAHLGARNDLYVLW